MELAILVISTSVRFLLLAGTAVFGFAAGNSFGWSVPHWAGDSELEGSRYDDNYGAYGGDGESGGCAPFLLMAQGLATTRHTSWLPIFWTVLAAACVLLQFEPVDMSMAEDPGLLLLMHKPTWLCLGAAAAGYIIARVSDKGPVGPLE